MLNFDIKSVVTNPYNELLAYEALLARDSSSLSQITKMLKDDMRVSQLKNLSDDENIAKIESFIKQQKANFSILTSRDFSYPNSLRTASYKYPILYYKGDVGLLDLPKLVSVVGTRAVSDEGRQRTIQIVKGLVDNEFNIVSGLAKGVDTIALQTSIKKNGKVIGVIGTPINEYYPKENKALQDKISQEHLLISHVPMYRYANEPFANRRFYFPQRNAVMSSISKATIIIEASETSGTLTQARECMKFGKKLFILNSCFENKSIAWPEKFEKQGAIRVNSINDILDNF